MQSQGLHGPSYAAKITRMAANGGETTVDPLWYKDAIIYELHVKTFCDSDGDGMGDFRGLIEKLDYLQELGITAIWLLPFYPSPMRDDGYDIADYCDVNPNFGTLDDFRAFLDAAHQRNLRVITELVINHTSDQNSWFQKSRRAVAAYGVGDSGRLSIIIRLRRLRPRRIDRSRLQR